MPYLNAVIKVLLFPCMHHPDSSRPLKEGLRFHPPLPQFSRIALQDDILPLSKPILTESGEMINEVLVPKGTEIVVSIAAYNR